MVYTMLALYLMSGTPILQAYSMESYYPLKLLVQVIGIQEAMIIIMILVSVLACMQIGLVTLQKGF